METGLEARFWSKVTSKGEGECWLWHNPGVSNRGYGLFYNGERMVAAHRWLYEQINGPLPRSTVLDHLCRVRSCVNPAHLEPVSPRVNVLRGTGLSAKNAQKTHCGKGHPLDGDNLYLAQGKRHCRQCRKENNQARLAARKTMPAPAERTHCPQGHPYEGDNLAIEGGKRVCRTCRRAKSARDYAPRSKGKGLPADRTHCPKGHPYEGDNLYRTTNGRRACRECRRVARRRYYVEVERAKA